MPIATSNPKIPVLAMALAGLVPAWGQAINIRGIVYDSATGGALSGAKAALASKGLSATTDSKGFYSILQTTTGMSSSVEVEAYPAVRLSGSVLTYRIAEGRQQPVSISVSDVAGRGFSLFAGTASAGSHSMDISPRLRTPGVYLLRTVVGEVRTTHVMQVMKNGRISSMETAESVVAGRADAAAWDTLVLTKSGYNTRKVVLASATDSVPKQLLGTTATSGIPVQASLSAGVVGFANVGTAITGGGNAVPVTVTTCADLKAVAADKNPRVIRISGTITISDCNGGYGLPIASNKTLIGVDKKATVYGGLYVNSGVTNVIIRNLNCHGIWPNAGADDAVHIQGATHVWLDHLNIWDATDGNLDITGEADYVTVSWCKFWYTSATHTHRLNGLIGSGGGDHPEDWGKLHVTYHHNWFSTLVNERMPRLMYGNAHVYNDYYTSSGNGYCIGFGSYGSILVENNYFKGVANPISFMYDVYAWIVQRGNTYDNTTGTGPSLSGKQGNRAVTGQDFAVVEFKTAPYTYVLDKAADIPNLVGTYAGPQ